jgi:hypothetical protein
MRTKKRKLTLKAGTGRRIVELDSLAMYWYKGKLLCAALKKQETMLKTIDIQNGHNILMVLCCWIAVQISKDKM